MRTSLLRVTLTLMLAASALAPCGCARTRVEGALETRSEDEVRRAVDQRAAQLAAALGGALDRPATTAVACEGRRGELSDRAFFVQGAYQLAVPAARHLTALDEARTRLASHGLTVTRARTYADGKTGELVMSDPKDGSTITLASARPPESLAVFVHSRCYASPTAR